MKKIVSLCVLSLLLVFCGCKGQTGTLLHPGSKPLSGSHQAGQEVYKPMVDEAVGKLLSSASDAGNKRICFVGVENLSAEELTDYRDELYEMIDQAIMHSGQFTSVSRRYVAPAIRENRFLMDDLFLPENQRKLQASLEKAGQPFEYLLFAKLTSGTTQDNRDKQRDYRLSLELINISDGSSVKESCELSKAYNVSLGAKIRNGH